MRIQVIYGIDSQDITNDVNRWLAENEERYVIVSISPAMPRGKDGAFVTIQYTQSEKIFNQVEDSRD